MTTRPNANTPEAPQEATERRQSAPGEPGGQRETLRGQNGPQKGAQSLDGERQPRSPIDRARQQAAEHETQLPAGDLQQRITAAIRDTPARYPDDIVAAVWQAVEKPLDALRAELDQARTELNWRAAAESADAAAGSYAGRAEQAEAALARVRDLAAELSVAGRTETERAIGRRFLNALQGSEDDGGPTVAEAAGNDRRWPLEKHGE
ncbi:hypothetical protein [Streptomyces sp. NPDC008137]|uniref:hypothetical protein n=1 Tax=Streptomyces sp. NPDC008137 TaxID=3364813 RepID=UPI0036E01D1D